MTVHLNNTRHCEERQRRGNLGAIPIHPNQGIGDKLTFTGNRSPGW
jgi:hypothetical protein